MGVLDALKNVVTVPLPPALELPPPKGLVREAANKALKEAGEFVRDLTADHGQPVVDKIVRNLKLVASRNGHGLNGKGPG